MSLLPKGTKVRAKLYDCTDSCGAPHDATIIEVDDEDPTLPYYIQYDDPANPHKTWAEFDEVSPA